MIKGYPRPRQKVNGKTYPVPYSAETEAISRIDGLRMAECASNSLCIVCGLAVGEFCHALRHEGKVFAESGPFHDSCLSLTMAMCPHIVSDSGYDRFTTDTEMLITRMQSFWN